MPRYALVCLALLGCAGEPDPRAAFARGDYAQALRLYGARAAAGDAEAQNYLGIHYQLGLGTARDAARAAYWYRAAALAGRADARRNLGTLYQLGAGVPQDRVRAYGWYHHAALQGNRSARAYIDAMAGELTPNQIMRARDLIGREIANPAAAQEAGGGGR